MLFGGKILEDTVSLDPMSIFLSDFAVGRIALIASNWVTGQLVSSLLNSLSISHNLLINLT